MPWVIIHTCPICDVPLPYDESFLKDGDLVATCPSCHRDCVIKAQVKCDVCSHGATQLKKIPEAPAKFRCDMHNVEAWDKLRCSNCGTQLPKKAVQLKDCNLVATCSKCKTETAIRYSVKCDQCPNTANYFGWVNDPERWGYQIPKLGCEEHRFDPKPYISGPRIGMAMLAVLLTVAALFLQVLVLISLPLSLYVAFKAKEKQVRIVATVAIVANIFVAALWVVTILRG